MAISLPSQTGGFAQGMYASLDDLQSQWGGENIRVWSNLDNTVYTVNVSRCQAALSYADSEIISFFKDYGNYTTPLQPYGTDVVIVTRWDAVIAGVWLYQSRGLRDKDEYGDHLIKVQANVRAEMFSYRASNKLLASKRWPQSTAPVGYCPL
jgi:hypothetical protein